MTRAAQLRKTAAAALAGAILLGAAAAEAHLLPAQRGTVNVVGSGVFVALSVPASSFSGVDDDHDGVIDVTELDRHEAELRAEIERRLVIRDGSTRAATVRIDLMLSPQHDAAGDRADQIVVLEHADLGAPPRDLRVRCDLFGPEERERSITLTATRHPGSGTETEIGVVTPAAPDHAFFTPPPGPALGGAGAGVAALGALSAIAAGLASRSRGRGRLTPQKL